MWKILKKSVPTNKEILPNTVNFGGRKFNNNKEHFILILTTALKIFSLKLMDDVSLNNDKVKQ